MIKLKWFLAIIISASLNGCGNSSSDKILDEIKRLSEATYVWTDKNGTETSIHTIDYFNNRFAIHVHRTYSDSEREEYRNTRSFSLGDLDFDLMKYSSSFVKKETKKIWISCKNRSKCIRSSYFDGPGVSSTPMKINSDNRVEFINLLNKLKNTEDE